MEQQSYVSNLLLFVLHQYTDGDRNIGKKALRRALSKANPHELHVLLTCAMIMQDGSAAKITAKLRHGYKRHTGDPDAQAIIEAAAAIAQTRGDTTTRHYTPRPAQPPAIDLGNRIELDQVREPRPIPRIARHILSDLTGYRGTTDPYQEAAEQARREQYADSGALMPAIDDTEPVTTRRRILTRGADPSDEYEHLPSWTDSLHREDSHNDTPYDGGENNTAPAPLCGPVCRNSGCSIELAIHDWTHPRALCDDCAEDLEITRRRNAQRRGIPYQPLARQDRTETLCGWLDSLARRPDRARLLIAAYLNAGRNPHADYTVSLGKAHRDGPERFEQPQVIAVRALIAAWFYNRTHRKPTPTPRQVATLRRLPHARITHARHFQDRLREALHDDDITEAAHTENTATPSRYTKKWDTKKINYQESFPTWTPITAAKMRDTNVINYEEFFPTWKPLTASAVWDYAERATFTEAAKADPDCPTTKHIRDLMDRARRHHRAPAAADHNAPSHPIQHPPTPTALPTAA